MFAATPAPAPVMNADDAIAASDDLLIEFFDFFDGSVDEIYAYILHRTRTPDISQEIIVQLYFSLLQQKRFFWWRKKLDMSGILTMADKAIAAKGQWQEEAAGDAYIKELSKILPIKGDATEQAKALTAALKKLPAKDQKIAIIALLLKWPPKRAAETFGVDTNTVTKQYDIIADKIVNDLTANKEMESVNSAKFITGLKSIVMPPELKESIRLTILEKFRKAQMSSLRYIMPVAALLLVFTTVTGGGLILSDPPASAPVQRSFIAAQTALRTEERQLVATLNKVEEVHTQFAATQTMNEVGQIAYRMTNLAADAQQNTDQELLRIFNEFEQTAMMIINVLLALLR